jgi:hypothetical protein
VLVAYATELAAAVPNLMLDPRVFLTGQPIYTARPFFKGMHDPVPPTEWVQILPGAKSTVALDLDRYPIAPRLTRFTPMVDWPVWEIGPPIDGPPELVSAITETAGWGLCPPELTEFGEHVLTTAYYRIINATSGQRYNTLNRESFSIGQFISTEIPEACARELLQAAAKDMQFNDKYTIERLHEIIETGLSEGAGRPR